MLRRITGMLCRLTYRQWAIIGSVLVIAISAAEWWKWHRTATVVRHICGNNGAINHRSNTLGPKWLQANVPAWIRDNYLTMPHTVRISASTPTADSLLSDLRWIPTLRSLTVWPPRDERREPIPWSERLRSVSRIAQLRELNLQGSKVVDKDLAPPGTLSRLQMVNLSNTEVGDAGLRVLLPLRYLSKVSIGSTKVTDAAMTVLSQFPNLDELDLSDTAITDGGLADLTGLRKLRSIALRKTRITDRGLVILSRFPALERIDLRETRINDAGLEALTRLKHLRWLGLDQTSITDAAIPHLIRIEGLQELTMLGTQVSDDGFMQFARARPSVTLPLPYR